MPKYTFECEDCTVRFERVLKMGEHVSHECPSCKEEAPRVMEGFAFSFADGGSAPANTGVHSNDYPTADKVVGKSADGRWNYLNDRDKAKAKAREAAGTHALMRVNGPGYVEYTSMTPTKMEERRRLAKQAIETTRTSKK